MKSLLYLLFTLSTASSACFVNRDPQLTLGVVQLQRVDTVIRYDRVQLLYSWKDVLNGPRFYSYGDIKNPFPIGMSMYAFIKR